MDIQGFSYPFQCVQSGTICGVVADTANGAKRNIRHTGQLAHAYLLLSQQLFYLETYHVLSRCIIGRLYQLFVLDVSPQKSYNINECAFLTGVSKQSTYGREVLSVETVKTLWMLDYGNSHIGMLVPLYAKDEVEAWEEARRWAMREGIELPITARLIHCPHGFTIYMRELPGFLPSGDNNTVGGTT